MALAWIKLYPEFPYSSCTIWIEVCHQARCWTSSWDASEKQWPKVLQLNFLPHPIPPRRPLLDFIFIQVPDRAKNKTKLSNSSINSKCILLLRIPQRFCWPGWNWCEHVNFICTGIIVEGRRLALNLFPYPRTFIPFVVQSGRTVLCYFLLFNFSHDQRILYFREDYQKEILCRWLRKYLCHS